MSAPQRSGAENQVADALRSASAQYRDLPQPVMDRLDQVLDHLPPADTLHTREDSSGLNWTERLRLRRVRYALVSATAAVIFTIGAVAVASQLLNSIPSGGSDNAAATTAEEEYAAEGGELSPDAADGLGEMESEDDTEAGSQSDEETAVETFASGTDYNTGTDLLASLRDLPEQNESRSVPEELASLADGGLSWDACREALVETYGGLPIAVDFALFENQPAVVALLVADSGEIAVAVSPACEDGVIEELHSQA